LPCSAQKFRITHIRQWQVEKGQIGLYEFKLGQRFLRRSRLADTEAHDLQHARSFLA